MKLILSVTKKAPRKGRFLILKEDALSARRNEQCKPRCP